eukprot:Filipodium_phascolosomae@DN2435_c0_g1_i1.p2
MKVKERQRGLERRITYDEEASATEELIQDGTLEEIGTKQELEETVWHPSISLSILERTFKIPPVKIPSLRAIRLLRSSHPYWLLVDIKSAFFTLSVPPVTSEPSSLVPMY